MSRSDLRDEIAKTVSRNRVLDGSGGRRMHRAPEPAVRAESGTGRDVDRLVPIGSSAFVLAATTEGSSIGFGDIEV